MTEIMMLLAFITGAVTVYLAMRGSHYPIPSETPVKRLRTPKIEQVAVQEEAKQEESIEKALHEMRPPNIFERRQQIENIERQQEQQRKKEIWGIQ